MNKKDFKRIYNSPELFVELFDEQDVVRTSALTDNEIEQGTKWNDNWLDNFKIGGEE